jgi:hypothetical protein
MKPQRSQRNTLCAQKNSSSRKISEAHKKAHGMKPEHTFLDGLGIRG